MRYCSKCGAMIEDERASFCSTCGTSLANTSGCTRCPRCGNNALFWNTQTALYECLNPECRARITISETPPQTTVRREKLNILDKKIKTGQAVHKNRVLLAWTISVSFVAIIFAITTIYYHGMLAKSKSLLAEQTSLSQSYSKSLDNTKDILQEVNAQLALSLEQVGEYEEQLNKTINELQSSRDNLSTAQGQLATTKTELTLTQTTLSSVRGQLTSAQNQLTSTQGQLTSAQSQLTNTQNELTLFKNTYGSVVASNIRPPFIGANIINQTTAKDPTWAQLQSFILADKTDNNKYITNIYMCGDYAREVHNNAEKQGIRAAYVAIEFSDSWHACNAFKTTDKGLVFIDCTGVEAGGFTPSNCDKVVKVKLGGEYIPVGVIPDWSFQWLDLGTVLDVQIYW